MILQVPSSVFGISNTSTIPIDTQWDERYIYLHEWLIFMVNVGKYTSHMDPMGIWKQYSPKKYKHVPWKNWKIVLGRQACPFEMALLRGHRFMGGKHSKWFFKKMVCKSQGALLKDNPHVCRHSFDNFQLHMFLSKHPRATEESESLGEPCGWPWSVSRGCFAKPNARNRCFPMSMFSHETCLRWLVWMFKYPPLN